MFWKVSRWGVQGRKRGSCTKIALTQSIFELEAPNFAWKFVWIVRTNYKSVKMAIFSSYFKHRFFILFFLICTFTLMYFLYVCNLFGLSIRTSIQNMESVAQKMAEL